MSDVILQENWRPVVGYEGFYEVSDLGRVRRVAGQLPTRNPAVKRNCKSRFKTPSRNQIDGHYRVNLSVGNKKRKFGVHRLVLEAFVGPCPDGMEACHFPDRDPANNALSNLRWDTHQANVDGAAKHGTRAKGETQGSAKLTEADVRSIRATYKRRHPTRSAKALAVKHKVSECTIRSVLSGRYWGHA